MSRSNLFIKVEVEHDSDEQPQRIGEEICRQLMKLYGVREAEVSSFATMEE
jgi:tetrahydromethanopterin S-methyltransferase subunit G